MLSGGEELEREAHEIRLLGVGHEARAAPIAGAPIADWCPEHPAPAPGRLRHACADEVPPGVVVELREDGDHAFHGAAGGTVVGRLGRGAHGDSIGGEKSPERVMVF